MENINVNEIELSIVMPCLNEAETLQICIDKAFDFLVTTNTKGEVVIGDNGSTDGSQQIAIACGARLIDIQAKGYGNALLGAFKESKGTFIIMGDSDDSYDFSHLNPFMEKLRSGYDLVIGNRFAGTIHPKAMPFMNKYVGNPVLSSIARLFIRSEIGDFHCGLRGFHRQRILDLNLRTPGMEFASEMIIAATIANLKITEVPIILSPDGRSRPPHLRPWRDGWRHLRFLFNYRPSPSVLFREFMLMLGGLIMKTCNYLLGRGFVSENLRKNE
jgi:glycosyltransferase involved in cell wall biosynthesis